MSRKMFVSVVLNTSKVFSSSLNKSAGIGVRRNLHTANVPVKEVKIPTRWNGHIAAKLWGNENERPILALHGWQDNAGTWDPMAPALAAKRPILAIDFPGHGLSSWYPKGMQYYPWDLPRLVYYIKKHFNWDKISLLGHSMGSIAAMRFASTFPDDVDFYVAIDSLIYDDYDLNLVVANFPKIIQKTEIAQTRIDTPAPCYAMSEVIDRWHKGTNGSVTKESVPHLLKRGAKESPSEPNKFYISRDPRLKNILFCPDDKNLVKVLVSRLKCPTLYIKARDSPYASDEYSTELRELIASTNPNFEWHNIPGTHHLHLNDPERVTPLIMEFLQKYKFIT
ncbi:probable serine hydrolase [Aricia agestis]|uniref:probable serine hydrolase n=1 Tax=Aricia agestis TaxID=91739 RepID=UPI001C207699|nr:probable serine hydrolase [Aricia agestis]